MAFALPDVVSVRLAVGCRLAAVARVAPIRSWREGAAQGEDQALGSGVQSSSFSIVVRRGIRGCCAALPYERWSRLV